MSEGQGMQGTVIEVLRASSDAELLSDRQKYRDAFFRDALILVDRVKIDVDHAFISKLKMGAGLKKLSTKDGVTRYPIVLKDGRLEFDQGHFLGPAIQNERALGKIVFEFREIEQSLVYFTKLFFHGFADVSSHFATFRFSKTTREGLHFDHFQRGKAGLFRSGTRIFKAFLNVDIKPQNLACRTGSPGLRVGNEVPLSGSDAGGCEHVLLRGGQAGVPR